MLLPPLGIGEFQAPPTLVALSAGVSRLILQSSPTRIAIVFGTATNAYTISTRAAVGVTTGIIISQTAVPFQLHWSTVGGLVNVAWYGISAIGQSIEIIEVLYRPTGQAGDLTEGAHANIVTADRGSPDNIDAISSLLTRAGRLGVRRRPHQ